MRDRRLAITISLAVLVLLGATTAILLLDPRVTSADAVRTGGFAAGSVVAMYALWLNDRRRRVEEQRQLLEQRGQELDSERYALEQRRQELEDRRWAQEDGRGADERFARSVELLGNDADQVRVGALHALAGLARTHSDYTQTVLDVLCAYLRRPFQHPRYSDSEQDWTPTASDTAERELQARLTAQRLLADLLPDAEDSSAPDYNLDLTGATLEYLDLSGLRIGTLVMRYASLYSSTNLSRCEFTGPVWLTRTRTGAARLSGNFRCADTVFRQRAWFPGVRFHGPVYFDRTRFTGRTKFADATFIEPVSMLEASFEGSADFRDVAFGTEVLMSSASFSGTVLRDGLSTEPGGTVSLPPDLQPDAEVSG